MKGVLVIVFLVGILNVRDVTPLSFGFVQGILEKIKEFVFAIYELIVVIIRRVLRKNVTEDKVTFHLFANPNRTDNVKLNTTDLERFRNTSSKIIFIIHGWKSSRDYEWYEDLKNAFFSKDNSSVVIQVDWREPASCSYLLASVNTFDVSEHIAKLIVNLHKNYGVPRENFLLVGHSLGAHVIGFIGKRFQKETSAKLPRIVALDPAGPLFKLRPKHKRLNEEDAEVVEVIHTDGGGLGIRAPCGTIDFFFNGGRYQPPCKDDPEWENLWKPNNLSSSAMIEKEERFTEEQGEVVDYINVLSSLFSVFLEPIFCDHGMAYKYFTQALLEPGLFVGKKCHDNLKLYKIEPSVCFKTEIAYLGDLNTTSTGSFNVDTREDKDKDLLTDMIDYLETH